MLFDSEQMMPKQQRFSLPPTIDDLSAAPLVVKDALRGIRLKLRNLAPNIDETGLFVQNHLPLSPLAIATTLFNETRKITLLGEDIARDVLLRHRDEARLTAFAGSGFGRPLPEHQRHDYVSSRYAALKILAGQFKADELLILEQPIDMAYLTLLGRFSDVSLASSSKNTINFDKIAISTIELEKSGAVNSPNSGTQAPRLGQLIFAALGLAETILALSTNHSVESTLAALNLAADVIVLRKPSIAAIFDE
ncbi:MAG: hypothetical protein EBU34_05195, partial [Alphaproteobacteria bacterium]|nr:hypothetical protein [Alphaproteobacteria bacterium]